MSSRAEIDSLPADVLHVVGVGIEDDEVPALLRLRQLETLELRAVVPSPTAPDKPLVPLDTVSDDGLLRLATMKSIRSVILVHQHGLTARGFEVLRNLPALESLTLRDSDADDAALTVLAKLERLRSLQLTSCWRLGRPTLDRIAAMPSLRTLRLEHQAFETEWLRALGTRKDLVELELTMIHLPQSQPAQLPVRLYRPAVTDELLGAFVGMRALRALDIRFTGTTSDGERPLRECLPELLLRTGPADTELR